MAWLLFRGLPRPRPRLFSWDRPRALLPEASALWAAPPRAYEPGYVRPMLRALLAAEVMKQHLRLYFPGAC